MTIETARWLLSEQGRETVAFATEMRDGSVDLIAALTRLRRRVAPDLAASAWEMAELRHRGRAKFGSNSAKMWFTREALEQASGPRTASYHARRFRSAGIEQVADVCGGIGGDAIAFARAGLTVTCYERDDARALLAAANMEALGLGDQVEVVACDVTATHITSDSIWFDPSRRRGSGRVGDPEDYLPPLSLLRQWDGKPVGVKLAPAVDHSVADRYGADLEFISDRGECKEALLWLSTLRAGARCRAVLVHDDSEKLFETLAGDPPGVASADEQGYLYEPDPAVIRAGGIATLASHLCAKPAAPQIAYLIGPEYVTSPFAAPYRIIDRFPFSMRRLQVSLLSRDIGHVVIKKRGFPKEPDAVRKELKLKGQHTITVVLTRAPEGNGHQVILCEPVET